MKNQHVEELKFYTSAEVADILKMNPQVIARKLQGGEMEGYKIGRTGVYRTFSFCVFWKSTPIQTPQKALKKK